MPHRPPPAPRPVRCPCRCPRCSTGSSCTSRRSTRCGSRSTPWPTLRRWPPAVPSPSQGMSRMQREAKETKFNPNESNRHKRICLQKVDRPQITSGYTPCPTGLFHQPSPWLIANFWLDGGPRGNKMVSLEMPLLLKWIELPMRTIYLSNQNDQLKIRNTALQ